MSKFYAAVLTLGVLCSIGWAVTYYVVWEPYTGCAAVLLMYKFPNNPMRSSPLTGSRLLDPDLVPQAIAPGAGLPMWLGVPWSVATFVTSLAAWEVFMAATRPEVGVSCLNALSSKLPVPSEGGAAASGS